MQWHWIKALNETKPGWRDFRCFWWECTSTSWSISAHTPRPGALREHDFSQIIIVFPPSSESTTSQALLRVWNRSVYWGRAALSYQVKQPHWRLLSGQRGSKRRTLVARYAISTAEACSSNHKWMFSACWWRMWWFCVWPLREINECRSFWFCSASRWSLRQDWATDEGSPKVNISYVAVLPREDRKATHGYSQEDFWNRGWSLVDLV